MSVVDRGLCRETSVSCAGMGGREYSLGVIAELRGRDHVSAGYSLVSKACIQGNELSNTSTFTSRIKISYANRQNRKPPCGVGTN
jgi:hypothetical protein